MEIKKIKSRSKFLSLILRHQPELIHIKLEEEGWIDVQTLLDKITLHSPQNKMSFEELSYVVENNNKKRFGFDKTKTKIRAHQGHSVQVEMNYCPKTPPKTLFHGTAHRSIESIEAKGILKGSRQYVHLSADLETAKTVGARHGKPFIFEVDTFRMSQDGFAFYQSDNKVWLTEYVPAKYLCKL